MKRGTLHADAAATVIATLATIVWLATQSLQVRADDAAPKEAAGKAAAKNANAAATDAAPSKPAPAQKLPEPKGAKRLSRDYDVWVDPKKQVVIVDGQVSLREGMLEMFACTRNTKEHESVVSANTKAFLVHAALLSLGAETGRPAQFVPKYRPPTGTEIDVTVQWVDEHGKEHTAKAQDWIKDINTKKTMAHPFVFAGSSFWTDEETGKKFYQAEGGDFICVSNFSTAMLDVPVHSSQANMELAFEAFTERIPPLGAPVRLILQPKKEAGSRGQGAGSKTEGKQGENDAAKTSGATKAERNVAR
ncbi:MAG: YdjY domain-containing protein [Planctomycetes bacterium]|nr:YdjY domain-containing protein [Planctomycetota bacterium]